MHQDRWPEAANRRLRALLWKRLPLAEVALCLGRTLPEIRAQMVRLGMTAAVG